MFIPVKKDLSSQKFTTLKLLSYPMYLTQLSIITLVLVYSIIPGASHKNPDLVPNSGPIPDHFWHFGPDPDQVRNSVPFQSHCSSLGKPSFKKYRNFMKYFHKTVTPPRTAFMKSLFRFCHWFWGIYYFWIRDMKSDWPPRPVCEIIS